MEENYEPFLNPKSRCFYFCLSLIDTHINTHTTHTQRTFLKMVGTEQIFYFQLFTVKLE